jgi:ribosomal protein S18 acetylase RimI-like enzyme
VTEGEGSASEPALADLLARAFFDDPAFGYILPYRPRRLARLRWLFRRWLQARADPTRGDEVVLDGDGRGLLIGVTPAGHPDVPFWTMVRLGLVKLPFVFGARSARRFLAVDADFKRRHAAELREPHRVIDVLAVDPAAQGHGVGSALARKFLAAADSEGLPCYLVTHNPRNLGFYQRLGFAVLSEGPVTAGGPTGWSLRRPALAAGTGAT